MATLNPQQRNFLSQRLKVKVPQKKGFFSRASKDEKSDDKVKELYAKLLDEITKVKTALARLGGLLGEKPNAQRKAEVDAFAARLAAIDKKMEASNNANAEQVFKDSNAELAKLLAEVSASVKTQEADPKAKARAEFSAALTEAQRQLGLLSVIPNADTTAFAKMVDTAQASAGADSLDGYRQAIKDLAGCSAEFKRAEADATKAQKAGVAQSSLKPDCQTELAAAATEFDILNQLPGLEDIAAKFAAILQSAQGMAKGNRWADALKELAKLKTLPGLEQCFATSDEAAATLKGNKGYDEGMALLGKLKLVASAKEVAEQEKLFKVAVKAALASKQETPDLGPAAAVVQQALDAATQAKKDMPSTLAALERAYAEFKPISSRVDVTLVEARIKPLKEAQAAKEFGTAYRLASDLLAELTRDLSARKKAFAEWNGVKGQAPELVKQINTLRASAKCQAVLFELPTLMNRVVPHEVARLSDAAEWALLVNNITEAQQGIARLKALEASFAGFEKQRTAADAQVQPLIAAARAAIVALEAAVAKAGKASGAAEFAAGADFTGRLDQIATLWKSTLASAASEADLKLEATVAALAELTKAIAAANSPAAIATALKGNAQKLAQATFDKDWAVLQSEIVQLQAVDNQAAAAASAEAASLRQAASADWHAGLGALAKLNSRVARDRTKLAQGRDTKAAATAKTVTQVSTKLAELKKSTGKADKFGPFFDALQAECDQLALLAQSPNGDAIAEAEAGLKDMLARIELFAPGAPAKGGPAGPTLDFVAGRLADSEKALKVLTDLLTKNCPKTLARLNKDLAALRTALTKQDPLSSVKALDVFDAACESAKADAAKVIALRAEFEALRPSVQEAAAAFTAQKGAPEYAKALNARLDAAVKLAKNPDELYAAKLKLEAVDEELKAAALNPAAALAKEGQIRNKAQTDAQTKAEWERSLEIFQGKRLPVVEAALASGGAKGLLAELKNMLKAAKDTAGKGDHLQALKQLTLADARADEIIANPQGAGIGARKNLPADAKDYKDAVLALRELLGKFPEQVGTALPALPKAVTQRLSERVQTLAARFDPASFDTPVLMLVSANIDDKERRARREAALAQVRNARAVVGGHPLVASLARSPIAGAELSAALRRVDTSLARLDANISRSCA